jgi:hypothetical protein
MIRRLKVLAASKTRKQVNGPDIQPVKANNNRHQRRRIRAKGSKTFMLKFDDLHKQADVLFIGMEEHVGEVVAIASPTGRAAVDKIFPDSVVDWRGIRDLGAHFPDDWLEFNFLLPDLIMARHVNRVLLSEALLNLKDVDKISADQFAFLMVYAAKEQGARAALYSAKQQDIQIVFPDNCVN